MAMTMDSYLMMLYVTLEQESALKQFFDEQGWKFCKPGNLEILLKDVNVLIHYLYQVFNVLVWSSCS